MFHVNSFFEKIKKTLGSKDEQIKTIIVVILEFVKYEIDPKNIRIYGDTIYIRENPALKNEIFFKKKEILEAIANRTKTKSIQNIK